MNNGTINVTLTVGGKPGEGGTAATISVGATATAEPGTSASVVNVGTESNAVLDFTIPKGEKGENGYAPVRGVDYWTVADIAEIQAYIDQQIGVVANGSY